MVIIIATNSTNSDYIDFSIDGKIVSAIKRICTTRLDPDDANKVLVYFSVYEYPAHAPPPLVNQELLTYLNGNKKTLILRIDFNDVTLPIVVSGADLKAQIDSILGISRGTIFKVDTGAFTVDDYQDNRLIGKTADTEFMVYGDGGAGALLEEGSGYGFDTPSGTIQMGSYGGPTKLRIQII